MNVVLLSYHFFVRRVSLWYTKSYNISYLLIWWWLDSDLVTGLSCLYVIVKWLYSSLTPACGVYVDVSYLLTASLMLACCCNSNWHVCLLYVALQLFRLCRLRTHYRNTMTGCVHQYHKVCTWLGSLLIHGRATVGYLYVMMSIWLDGWPVVHLVQQNLKGWTTRFFLIHMNNRWICVISPGYVCPSVNFALQNLSVGTQCANFSAKFFMPTMLLDHWSQPLFTTCSGFPLPWLKVTRWMKSKTF